MNRIIDISMGSEFLLDIHVAEKTCFRWQFVSMGAK
jgi:hypothetical protein